MPSPPSLLVPVAGFYFDLVGTLIRSRAPIGEQYAAWARRHGAAHADARRMGQAFHRSMRDAPAMAFPGTAFEATAAAERDWWRHLVGKVVEESGLSGTLRGDRFEAFFRDLYRHFTTADAWETYPDALPALAGLRDAGHVVGLVTNYDTRVHAVLDALGLAQVVDSVTIPALVGAAKPDPAIFRHALGRHHIEPAQAVFVGDDPADDYAGAEAAGMWAVLVDREGKYGGTGMRTVRGLQDLVEQR
jgi:putative hydrolase of the HAD superfamily